MYWIGLNKGRKTQLVLQWKLISLCKEIQETVAHGSRDWTAKLEFTFAFQLVLANSMYLCFPALPYYYEQTNIPKLNMHHPFQKTFFKKSFIKHMHFKDFYKLEEILYHT